MELVVGVAPFHSLGSIARQIPLDVKQATTNEVVCFSMNASKGSRRCEASDSLWDRPRLVRTASNALSWWSLSADLGIELPVVAFISRATLKG